MEYIKPCPFCGGEVESKEIIDGVRGVMCSKCYAITLFTGDESKTLAAWNTRAEPEPRTDNSLASVENKGLPIATLNIIEERINDCTRCCEQNGISCRCEWNDGCMNFVDPIETLLLVQELRQNRGPKGE